MLQVAVGTVLLMSLWAKTTTISGRVTDHQAQPIGNAIVTIYACHPKSGPSRQNPSSYEACSKIVRTEEDGSFEITDLDTSLQFSLAISARGFQGTITKYADAENLKEFSLRPVTNVEKNTKRIRGRVVDTKGQPLHGAVVQMLSVSWEGGGSTVETSCPKVTITSEVGEFDFEVGGHLIAAQFQLTSPKLAAKHFTWNTKKETPIEVMLDRGGAITGQLIFQGKPVVANIGLSGSSIYSNHQVATDSNGCFRFDQLPPDTTLAIYTLLDQNIEASLPVTVVESPSAGKLADYGTITLQPAKPVQIKIVTSDVQPLPEKGQVYVGREMSQTLTLDIPSGRPHASVAVLCVGDEELMISVRSPNFEIAEVTPKCPIDQNGGYLLHTQKSREVTLVVRPK